MGTYACTGGASGIGAKLIERLSDAGHTAINVDLKDADILADLSNPEGRQAAIAGILERAPDGLDGFVPVAGLGGGSAPDELITRVNYFGTIELVEGLREALVQRSGAVVLLASNSASMGVEGDDFIAALLAGDEPRAIALAATQTPNTHYMLAKRALLFWMNRNAMDWGRDGVRINAVAPGPVLTAMTKPLFESDEYAPIMQGLLDATPLPRAAQPDEIADCIDFLLSDKASYVHGANLFIDGGFDAHTRQNHH